MIQLKLKCARPAVQALFATSVTVICIGIMDFLPVFRAEKLVGRIWEIDLQFAHSELWALAIMMIVLVRICARYRVYAAFPRHRQAMVWASFATAPLGLTAPLFVPVYWNPPSLFDLSRTTGFDIESVIFSFGIGGIAAVLYNLLTGRVPVPLPQGERLAPRHKLHYLAQAVPLELLEWPSASCMDALHVSPRPKLS